MKNNYKFKGIQKGIDDIPDLLLYNCNHCGTTIVEKNIENHLKNVHYNIYFTLIKKQEQKIAICFLNYVVGV